MLEGSGSKYIYLSHGDPYTDLSQSLEYCTVVTWHLEDSRYVEQRVSNTVSCVSN